MKVTIPDIFRNKNNYYIPISIGLIILFFYPLIFSDKTFYLRDIHRWFYPMKFFLASSFKNGTIPYWCPDYFCGAPFISDLQSGIFYPLSLIFLISPLYKAFNYFIIAHIFLGFCFFYLFLKELGLSKKAAIFSSISYSFGGYTIASINTLNNLTSLIWLPAILWAFTKATRVKFRSGYFLTVVFLCMMILGGEPQLFIISTGLLFLYGLMCISKKDFFKGHIKICITIFILIASALIITMVQLGPTYNDYQLSVRMGGISYEEATKNSLTIDMLKHIFLPLQFPDNFTTNLDINKKLFSGNGQTPWLLTVYTGFLIMPLAIFGLVSDFSKKTLFWFFIFVAGTALALGNYTPVYKIFFKVLPFFRFPVKFMFIASFSLLILAGYGVDRLFLIVRRFNIRQILVFIFISIILIIDLFSANKNLNPLCESAFYQKYHPYLEPILNDPDTFRIYTDPDMNGNPTYESMLNYHKMWQSLIMPNLGVLHNINQIDGTTGLELRYQYIITELLKKSWTEKIRFLRLSNVKYIISLNDLSKNPNTKNQVERINPIVFRIKDYLPRAWIVGQLRPIKNGTADELIDDSFDPTHSAITRGDILSKYDHPAFAGIKNVSYEKNNKIHIEVTTETPGILVLSESAYPGWQVFVDGKEKECLWLDLLFQGVEVEKGRHHIDFIYQPKCFKLFLLISLCSITLFFLIWLYYIRFGKKA
jgi:hypothetical protein